MSDRGRPHNLGQVLFESLGAGLGAYGSFLQNETERKSKFQKQSFLNRLSQEAGQRAQIGLDQGQQRIDNALIGGQSINPDFISALDQSQIDLRGAQQSAAEALALQRGTPKPNTVKPLTAKSRVDLLQNLFQQSVKGGRERLLGETIGRLGELGAFAPDTAQTEELFSDGTGGGFNINDGSVDRKPPRSVLGLRGFLAQNPELAQDSAVGDLSQRLFGLGSQEHQRAFTSTPDSSFAINPFVAQQIFPDVDLESLRIDDEDFVAGGSEALKLLREQVPGFDNYPDSVKVDFLNQMEAALAGEQ